MCTAHAAVRHLLGGLLEERHGITVVDMEAGLEHLSRGTARHVDTLLVTMEPYYKALETASRCSELARELQIPEILAVANKLRGEADRQAVRGYAAAHSLNIIAEVPFDEALWQADLGNEARLPSPDSPAYEAVSSLAERLIY